MWKSFIARGKESASWTVNEKAFIYMSFALVWFEFAFGGN